MVTDNNTDGAALLPVTQDGINAKDEWLIFQSWWKRQRPGDPVPSPASLIFDAWMQSARHRIATQEDAERSGVVTQEEVDAALAKFDGGLRRQSDERNARGYTTFYHPKDSMREVLEDFYARRKSTPQRQEYDGEAVREALAHARDGLQRICARKYQVDASTLWVDMVDDMDAFAQEALDRSNIRALAHPAQARDELPKGESNGN